MESQAEEYPLTRAFLTLLDTLTEVPIPPMLGAGHRTPGFHPYLEFVKDIVFLRFDSRAYRHPTEKVCTTVYVRWFSVSTNTNIRTHFLHPPSLLPFIHPSLPLLPPFLSFSMLPSFSLPLFLYIHPPSLSLSPHTVAGSWTLAGYPP